MDRNDKFWVEMSPKNGHLIQITRGFSFTWQNACPKPYISHTGENEALHEEKWEFPARHGGTPSSLVGF